MKTMRLTCPICKDEVDMKIDDIGDEGEVFWDMVSAPAWLICPNCGKHLYAEARFALTTFRDIEIDEDWYEDNGIDID